MKKPKNTGARPFTTDYGTSQGHCATARGAIKSMCRYMVDNGQRHATLEGPNGALARAYYNGHYGFTIEPARTKK